LLAKVYFTDYDHIFMTACPDFCL